MRKKGEKKRELEISMEEKNNLSEKFAMHDAEKKYIDEAINLESLLVLDIA